MNGELYTAFLIAAIGLTLMPGPDNLFVLSESILRGSKRGVSLSAGLASGVLIHTSLAASGLALVMQSQEMVYNGLLTAGALYLLYLAYGTFKEAAPQLKLSKKTDPQHEIGFWASFGKGFLINVLNPKVTLFFLALLPQFVDANLEWTPWQQMFTMGFSFMIQAFLIFSLIALISGRIAGYLSSPSFQNFSRWFQISILSLLAVGLLISAWL